MTDTNTTNMENTNTTNKSKLIYPEECYKIQGACFNVYNQLGGGHKEAIYQKSLEIELEKLLIPFDGEKSLPINYGDTKVGVYKPDFVVYGKIIVELKSVDFLVKDFELQLNHYLKSTGFELGLLVNFGPRKVEIKRRINVNHEYHKLGGTNTTN